MQVTLTFSKETKGTYMFVDSSPGTIMKAVYINKVAFMGHCPKAVKVTVEAVRDEA